jgi:hypothetical protein
MRRSRASLVLFFGTFATLLMAVGFADGGHQSPGRPADLYRLDLDDPADGCSAYSTPRLDEGSLGIQSVANEAADGAGLSGSQGWILVPMAGSPIAAVLFVDDDMACLLAYVAEGNGLPAAGTSFGLDIDNVGPGSAAGPEPENRNRLDAAVSPIEFGCEGFPYGCSTTGIACDEKSAFLASDRPIDDETVLNVAAAYAGLPNQLIWQHAIDRASRCQFVWDGCDGFPDASVAGWLDSRAMLRTVETWREVGRAARKMVDRIAQGRDSLIAATSRQIVGWLSWPAAAANQARRGPTEDARPSWPRTLRSTGLLLAL